MVRELLMIDDDQKLARLLQEYAADFGYTLHHADRPSRYGLETHLVNVHPLVNTMTTAVAAADLLRFFGATGHAPRWLDFPL